MAQGATRPWAHQGSVDDSGDGSGGGGGGGGGAVILAKFSAVCGDSDFASTVYMDDGGQAGGASFYRYPTSARTIARIRLTAPLGTTSTPPTATLYKDGVATAMTCTLPASQPPGATVLDSSHPIAFVSGAGFDVVLTQPANAEGPSYYVVTLEGAAGSGSGVSSGVDSVAGQTPNAVDNSSPANPVIQNASASNAGTMSAANFSLMPVDHRTTLLAPSNTVAVSGLSPANGDWECYFYLPINADSGLIKIQLDDSDADLYASWVEEFGASTVQGGRSSGSWELTGSVQVGGFRLAGWIRLRSSSTDQFLVGTLDLFAGEGPAGRRTILLTTAPKTINKISIVAANANTFATGAYLQVRELRRTYP